MLSVGDGAWTISMLSWWYWKGIDLVCLLEDLLEHQGGRTVGRALALGIAGVPARGVTGSVPAAGWVASRPGPAVSLW